MPSSSVIPPTTRKHLSLDPLLVNIHKRAEELPDARDREVDFSISDAVMSAVAVFSLKDPSLLAFQERRNDENMKNLYLINQVPSDTQMREMLDPLDPELLRPMFGDIFRELQRGKALEPFIFHQDCYLLSLDGTEYFSSKKVHCDSCLQKKNKKTGAITYHHQMLGAVLVHPDRREVIPLAPEPIVKQDGDNKNDCERNAAKRLLRKIRDEHPALPLIVVEDGLASNAPHIEELKRQRMHFLLGAKPDDHQHLFAEVVRAQDEERATTIRWTEPTKPNRPDVLCEVSFVLDLPLNKAHPHLRVNFLQCIERGADGNVRRQFSWVTDLVITAENARHLARGGRSRWKIENETFNTLKNQGYHFEHNYGHGEQNLSVVFAMLMMLTFLVDQTQQLCCPLFQAVHKKLGSRRMVWDHLRSHFRHIRFVSMQHLYEVVLNGTGKELPPPPAFFSRRVRAP